MCYFYNYIAYWGKALKKILSTLILLLLCISLFADINDELIEAAKDGDIDRVQQLIEKGADLNAKGGMFDRTALMCAACCFKRDGGLILCLQLLGKQSTRFQ